jgi:hypothetical protein
MYVEPMFIVKFDAGPWGLELRQEYIEKTLPPIKISNIDNFNSLKENKRD